MPKKTKENEETQSSEVQSTELVKQPTERELQIQKQKQLERDIESFILGDANASKMTENQRKMCIQIATRFKLNPLLREIHFFQRGTDVKIVVGYEVYLQRAESTTQLNGWEVDTAGTGKDIKCVITIHRKDWDRPFKHEVFLEEARQNTPVWQKMPRFMLKKVAIAQGFRLAFPKEFGGMPYMDDELGVDTSDQLSNGRGGAESGQSRSVGEGRPTQTYATLPEAKKREDEKPMTIQQQTAIADLLSVKGKSVEDLKNAVKTAFKLDNYRFMTEDQADMIIAKLERLPDLQTDDVEYVETSQPTPDKSSQNIDPEEIETGMREAGFSI